MKKESDFELLIDKDNKTNYFPEYEPPPYNSNEPKKKDLKNPFSELSTQHYQIENATHPIICLFTFLFKAIAFLCYLLVGLFANKVIVFILVTLSSAIDFWFVKNISGRLLIGLRWWKKMNSSGEENWIFETYDHEAPVNKIDSSFFWTSQIVGTIVWVVFLVINILGLSIYWALLCAIAFVLNAINLYGFYKCRSEYQKKLDNVKNYLTKKGIKTMQKVIINQAMKGNK